MKKTLLTTIFAAMLCLGLNAEVLLVEDFDYTAGNALTACGWNATYGGTCATSVTNGLEFDGYTGCGIGNGALISGLDGSYQPHKAFTAATSGDVYVAMMLNPYIVSKRTWIFSLRDAISTSTFNYNGRIWLNETNKIGLSYAKEGEKYADRVLESNRTYLVVLKYSIVSGTKNDSVSLFLLDAFTDVEPATPLLTAANTSKGANDDINPENIVLRSNNEDDWISVDGIRVATTWVEAVAAGDCPSTAIATTQSDALRLYAENGRILGSDDMQIFSITGIDVTSQNGSLRGVYVVKATGKVQKVVVK